MNRTDTCLPTKSAYGFARTTVAELILRKGAHPSRDITATKARVKGRVGTTSEHHSRAPSDEVKSFAASAEAQRAIFSRPKRITYFPLHILPSWACDVPTRTLGAYFAGSVTQHHRCTIDAAESCVNFFDDLDDGVVACFLVGPLGLGPHLSFM